MFLPLGQDLCVFQQPLGVLAGTGDTAGDLHLGEGGLARELVSLGLGRAGGGGPRVSTAKESQLPVTKPTAKLSTGGGRKTRGQFHTWSHFLNPRTLR